MDCIYCGQKTAITNSRPQKRLMQVWRRHSCSACGAVFTTIEAVELSGSLQVRHNASRQPFDRDTLYVSVYKALGHRKDAGNAASALTATIIAKVRTKASGAVIERNLIVTTALEVLANFDTVAAVQYGAYHPL